MFVVPENRRTMQPGQRYGRLTVSGVPFRLSGTKQHAVCLCDCGSYTIASTCCLRKGSVSSCGCRRKESNSARMSSHGESKTKLYRVWAGINSRCRNPNRRTFKNYGGRGIAVCDEWRRFEAFRNWSIAAGYREGLSIDRIENDKGYEPSNCRWVTQLEQCNNMRKNRHLIAFGEKKTIAEWSRDPRCLVPPYTFCYRIRNNWDVETALACPVGKRKPA